MQGILLYTSGLYTTLEALGVPDHKAEVLYLLSDNTTLSVDFTADCQTELNVRLQA